VRRIQISGKCGQLVVADFLFETEFCDQFIITVTGGGVIETKICRVNLSLFSFEKILFLYLTDSSVVSGWPVTV